VLDTDIHKSAEVHQVADRALEYHTGSEVFHLEHIRADKGRGCVGMRVAPRARRLLKDVFWGE